MTTISISRLFLLAILCSLCRFPVRAVEQPKRPCLISDFDQVVPVDSNTDFGLGAKIPVVELVSEGKQVVIRWKPCPADVLYEDHLIGKYREGEIHCIRLRKKQTDSSQMELVSAFLYYWERTSGKTCYPFFIITEDNLAELEAYFMTEPKELFLLQIEKSRIGGWPYACGGYTFTFSSEGPRLSRRQYYGRFGIIKEDHYNMAGKFVSTVIPELMPFEELMMAKASLMRLSNIELKNVALRDALEEIQKQSKANDPDRIGITVENDIQPYPIRPLPSATPPPKGWQMTNPLDDMVSYSKRNIRVTNVIQDVTQQQNCIFYPTRTGVFVSLNPMQTERVSQATFPLEGIRKKDLQKIKADPMKFFTNCGVYFPDNAICKIEENGKMLFVRGTSSELDIVHSTLQQLLEKVRKR